ncbi:MFS transporter [Francisella frigiditurris]|uniref:Major Facilitator Superfamily protein n=1 Tax=Francisella frigiditurris TaxID=1542390 RepID=A0A1J0KU28_9GAMM|nr:MFS transporter [Francisella frigiditurris]APC97158.1 major Facilitator Superfamily protein [Francisella frigiditurris]
MNDREKFLTKFKILLAFFSLSFLVYCFPILIMQATSYYKISHGSAGALESYFNITRVIASLVAFTIFLKFGYKKPLSYTFFFVAIFCLVAPFINSIWMIRLYLLMTGISFVVIKISSYSMVTLVTNNPNEHASFVNFMELIHMIGNMMAVWVFSFFMQNTDGTEWLYMFWLIAGICLVLGLIFLLTPLNENAIETEKNKPFKNQIKDVKHIILMWCVPFFFIMFFAYEFIEQGVGPWLMTFNHEVLGITKNLSVQLGSLFTLAIALGRLYGTIIFKYIEWHKVLLANFIIGLFFIGIVMFNMDHGIGSNSTNIFNLPLVAYCLPLVGFFIGPVYPTLVSTFMSCHNKGLHAAAISIVMILGAFVDSVSARIVGDLFSNIGGLSTFKFSTIIPLTILIILIVPYALIINKTSKSEKEE